jgi:CO/xanthine dehydrogenase FAD-binding subunit
MYYNSLYECAKHMGSPQVRNTATIGGNIVNAGSAADIIPCILAHDGILVIESKTKIRKVSCRDYFNHYSEEKVKEDELLTKILLPVKEGTSGYYKLGKRNSLAISRLNVALTLKCEGNSVKEMTVALGAVGRYPFRSDNLENFAVGKNIIDLTSDEALRILEEEVMESIKGRKTMPFKKEAVKGVYKEALRIALSISEN